MVNNMQLRIAEYPPLRLIAWNRKDDDVIEEDEALALYERHFMSGSGVTLIVLTSPRKSSN
jgi:hypothetical protein